MSHHIDETRGAFARPAWHRLGAAFTNATDIDQCAVDGRMTHTVEKIPAHFLVPGLDDDGAPVMVPTLVPNQYHLVRDDDRAVVSPCTVTDRYSVLQPADIIDAVRPFVDQGWATVDGMFSLYGGGSDVITLRLDAQMDVDGDDSAYQGYLVVQNFHGRGTCRAKLTTFRVVCHNTSSAAFGTDGRGRGTADWSLRHTGDVQGRLAFAASTWEQARQAIARQADALGLFARKSLVVPDAISAILGVDEDSSTRASNRRDLIVDYARKPENDRGGNALTVFNAFTGWATHDGGGKAGKSLTGRVESSLDGDRAKVVQRAADALVAMVTD